MRPLAFLGLLCVLGGAPSHAAETRIHLSGFFWEDGGFPPSVVDEEFQAVGVVNAIVAPLFWSPDIFSYTWYLRDLFVASSTEWHGTHQVNYAGGQFTIYVDLLPSNHNYGSYPENDTVPSTFTDGHGVYLSGRVLSAQLLYDASTNAGSFAAEVQFTSGNAYPNLESATGWTIGSYLSGLGPEGYGGQVNGALYVDGPTADEPTTWASLKSLYR